MSTPETSATATTLSPPMMEQPLQSQQQQQQQGKRQRPSKSHSSFSSSTSPSTTTTIKPKRTVSFVDISPPFASQQIGYSHNHDLNNNKQPSSSPPPPLQEQPQLKSEITTIVIENGHETHNNNNKNSNIENYDAIEMTTQENYNNNNNDKVLNKDDTTAATTTTTTTASASASIPTDTNLNNNNNKNDVDDDDEYIYSILYPPAEQSTATTTPLPSFPPKAHKTSTSSSTSSHMSERFDQVASNAFSKLFGDSYDTRECIFVLLAGALIALNIGMVNGAMLSGLVTPPNQIQSIAGFSSTYTKSALSLAEGSIDQYGYHVCLILSYMGGSFICGLITPNGTPYQIEPTYGPTFLIGGILLLSASLLAAFAHNDGINVDNDDDGNNKTIQYVFYLAAGANGIQNGIASIYSANLLRCSMTGSSTDVALMIGQILRGNYKKLWKGLVLLGIIANFWIGGLISFYTTKRFLTHTLLINTVLFWLIGLGLIYFLVKELNISVQAAITGTWKWKRALGSLHEFSIQTLSDNNDYTNNDFVAGRGGGGGGGAINSYTSFENLFDIIDEDGNGEIEPEELLEALLQAKVKINAKGVMVLIKAADEDGDGKINREEWKHICEQMKTSL